MGIWAITVVVTFIVAISIAVIVSLKLRAERKAKDYERALKMVPMLIHLPPTTDDIDVGGRDERDVVNEALSQAQVMYSIISSTLTKGFKSKIYGQRHISFEIVAANGLIKYYAVVPAVITETVKQAVVSAYPSARLEEIEQDSIFAEDVTSDTVVGGKMVLKKDFVYPINTYEDLQRDATLAVLNAMSTTKQDEGMALQIMFRPTDGGWTKTSEEWIQNLKKGKKNNTVSTRYLYNLALFAKDALFAFWRPPEEHGDDGEDKHEEIPSTKQDEIAAIEKKMKYPGFETRIQVIASSKEKSRSEAMLSGLTAAFSQFDSQSFNGLKYEAEKDSKKLVVNYVFRFFPVKDRTNILNSMELATLFHLPAQNAIPTSQVERQATRQVEAPAKLPEEGLILGENRFRGTSRKIRLTDKDRRRHTYIIGATGMGKSVLLTNLAYQDMVAGRGFAFVDPHGDAAELLMSKIPEDRMDDVIYFDPADMEHPIGMNMFEFNTPDQKDFIVQEGINMLQSLFDPSNQGFFGPRGQHMFRNAALLLMADPHGATFIDIPQCFTDPEFVKQKLKYVTDKAVYDYWTKEFPASQKSNDAGEVITWFTSKWGPFLSNTTMRNILGQTKSGFNIREIMDSKKIFLVNLSKGRLGDINAQLLGMILVMKFQQAAMSRADMDEDKRVDFCLYVDEFQNFATDSFESILSEARKYRLNLIVANQFMTQLTEKIREAILGNVGTIMCGRIGVTDAELMEKAFSPVFSAEDLHKQGNFHAISTVMMFDLPSAPFTMNLLPSMGTPNPELLETMKQYSAAKYAKSRSDVEAEIQERWASAEKEAQAAEAEEKKEDFLNSWKKKKAEAGAPRGEAAEPRSEAEGRDEAAGSNGNAKNASRTHVEAAEEAPELEDLWDEANEEEGATDDPDANEEVSEETDSEVSTEEGSDESGSDESVIFKVKRDKKRKEQ